ncbi:hypothetical protein QE152_g180 [Popillia japonica]|uniref:Uncharacterized protein n=1 Tax=Popillia japonica TaxID=7064 RepID=A0AAW1NK90_POPJA
MKRPEKSSMFAFTEDMTMVSYIPKPNRQVILLSTLHHDDSIDPESGQNTKPEIISKGGVDVVDQRSAKYNVAEDISEAAWQRTSYGLYENEDMFAIPAKRD